MRYLKAMLVSVCCTLAVNSWAGRSCEPSAPDVYSVRMAFATATQLQNTLNQDPPQVALVARVGQDLSKYQLRYSHIAFVVKEQNQWRVKHLLNECGTTQAQLWREGLANFLMDTPFSYQVLLITPSPAVQQKILTKLNDIAGYRRLFTPNYNMLAYPFSSQYINSNQWVLELMASALAEGVVLSSRDKVQQWLKLHDYQATTLQLSASTRLGARMFRANVHFDDHPNERRFANQIDTVTVDSVERFIRRIDPTARVQALAEPQLASLP